MIYLDSAATSFLKPPQVKRAVVRALEQCTSPGRGLYPAAMAASEIVYRCRQEAAELFHAYGPENIVFTSNATHGLNIAIRSLVRPGDRVVVSGYEHNAVMRPLHALGADIRIADTPLFDGRAAADAFAALLPGARAAICTHVSNVFGFILPLDEIAGLCRKNGVPLIVDAAQSAGILVVDARALGARFIAMPGHKGLLGPQGTGILICQGDAEPLLYGGTGSMSDSPDMPELLPDRLEAGTQNVWGVAGLLAGIRAVRAMGTESVRKKEQDLLRQLKSELSGIPGLRTFFSPEDNQAGVLSLIPEGTDCESFARLLGDRGIAVRAGLHCAPQAHITAGTRETGTVRLSLSPYNTRSEIVQAASVIRKLTNNNYKL